MIKNSDMPAMPSVEGCDVNGFPFQANQFTGLTKREHFALHLYSGMLSACDQEGTFTGLGCADEAVKEADALLAALESGNG